MPIRIRWNKGQFLGIMLMFFAACGLYQVVYIAHGQYLADVGSFYAVILVPVGVTLALTFCAVIVYEALAQRKRTARIRKMHGKGQFQGQKIPFYKTMSFIALASTFILFFLFYLVAYAISATSLPALNSFIIAENVGAIGALVVVSLFEQSYAPKKVTY